MSDGDDFDPRMYPELFADDDMNPMEMAMLMQAIYGSEQQHNTTDTQEQNDKPNEPHPESLFAPSPQSESLFSQAPLAMNGNPLEMLSSVFTPNDNGEIEISENQLINNPILLQTLMQMMATEPSMFSAMDDNPSEEYLSQEPTEVYQIPQLINTTNVENEVKTKAVTTETPTELAKSTHEIENKDDTIIEHLKHKKSNKCNFVECKTKLGMLGFDCKCGYKFCSKHRYVDDHKCPFDHASFDKEVLRKNNIGIKAEKLNRID
jgi:hypothetical protein